MLLFNPIPAGVNMTPPPKSHVSCPNMTNDTSLKDVMLYFYNLQKNANLQKLESFFFAKSNYIVKMFAKKICPKNDKIYIFEKPLTIPL